MIREGRQSNNCEDHLINEISSSLAEIGQERRALNENKRALTFIDLMEPKFSDRFLIEPS